MKVAEYKGYEIEFYDGCGQFGIKDISGWFDKFKDATAKIDRVIKAEVKDNFPIDVVKSSMIIGKITSYNKIEQDVWFSSEGGRRGKERIVSYSGKPQFYKANDNNLTLTKRYKELSEAIAKINKEMARLEKGLTEPITFKVSED